MAAACAVPENPPLTPGGNYAIGITNPEGNIVPAEIGLLPITGATYQNNTAIVASADWTISPKDNFRGRYIYNKQNTLDTAAYLPTFWSTLPSRYQLIALTEYHNFTPNITNEFRLGYNRYYNDTPVGNFAFPGLDMFPNLTFEDMGAHQRWSRRQCSAVDDSEPLPGDGQRNLGKGQSQLEVRL